MYNRSELLQKAIASVRAQSYQNWELLVVDDGSTDDCDTTIQAFADPRISLITLGHSGHIGLVRNAGARAAKGAWLTFLDSDDTWMPGKLQLQLDALQETGLQWCYGAFEHMDATGTSLPFKAGCYRPVSGWIIKDLLTTEASVHIGTVMVHKTLFEKSGGFHTHPGLDARGDYELMLRLTVLAEVIALPNLLNRVLEHTGRTTNQHADGRERTALAYEIFLQTKPARKWQKIASKRRGMHLADAASMQLGQRNYRLACRQFLKAIKAGASWNAWMTALAKGLLICLRQRRPGRWQLTWARKVVSTGD